MEYRYRIEIYQTGEIRESIKTFKTEEETVQAAYARIAELKKENRELKDAAATIQVVRVPGFIRKEVEKWFQLDSSRNREDEVKYNIAVTVEGWLNGARDAGYEPMTRAEMEAYTYQVMQEWYNGSGYSTSNKGSVNSLHFYGKENTINLIKEFIKNYEDLQPYLKD